MVVLTREFISSILDYDDKTGIFKWTENAPRNRGKIAGCLCVQGYIVLRINRKTYKAHRLAWLYVYGSMPDKLIDHINGNKSDNSILNLRNVDDSVNQQNQKIATTRSKTGFLGVCTHKNSSRYSVRVKLNGKSHYFGTFDTPEEAHAVYLENKRVMHEGCTI